METSPLADTERVVFFAPHAGIWVHAFPEALVADAVRRAGGDVTYVTCGRALSSYCAAMTAHGVTPTSSPAQKAKVCRLCERNRNFIRRDFGFRSYDFESVLTAADERRVGELLGTLRRDEVHAFVVDGVHVGRSALYEYTLHRKRSGSIAFDDAEWAVIVPRVANTLRSLLAAQRVIDRERATRVVAYNTLYSVNAMWRAVADQRGIPVYVLHAGPSLERRLQTLMVARDSTTMAMYRLIADWPTQAAIASNADEVTRVTDHFCEVLRGTSVFAYSAPTSQGGADWRSRYGIRADQQLLVATLSSYDEYEAARAIGEQPAESSLAFPTQIAWIRALVAWIRDRPDRFLLIRVHPREFPNKREGAKSTHASLLERELVDLPANVRVNWPSDGLSMYDIAEYAAVVLNAWSSVGKEMALLGKPVVVYAASLLMYAPDLNYVGETPTRYFAAIETALRDGWSFEIARKAYRWCAVEYVRAIADLGDGFDYSEVRGTSLVARAHDFVMTLPGVRPARDLWRRPRALAEDDRLAHVILGGRSSLLDIPAPRAVATIAEETAAVRVALGRLQRALYGEARGAAAPGTLRAQLAAIS